MSTSAEKLVKQCVKLIAKTQDLDYEELKSDSKKVIKMARSHDENLGLVMEELLELGNVGSPEELEDFNLETLMVYCRIKELDDSGSENSIRSRVWRNMEAEFELESESESESEYDESESESESEINLKEPEEEVLIVEPEPVKKPKKEKKEKVVIINE